LKSVLLIARNTSDCLLSHLSYILLNNISNANLGVSKMKQRYMNWLFWSYLRRKVEIQLDILSW
jgi:hypothetical protein